MPMILIPFIANKVPLRRVKITTFYPAAAVLNKMLCSMLLHNTSKIVYSMATVLITGGTGLVGRQLTDLLLQKGYEVIVMSRKAPTAKPGVALRYAQWNVAAQTIDVAAVQQADYIVHLAGAGVMDKRWTAAWQREIVESRTLSSRLLADTLRQHPHRVKAVISASAIGWYGPDATPPVPFTEEMPHHTDFLGDTCYQWEQNIQPVEELGIRLVKLRIGIVLSKGGGALEEFEKPLRFRIAGILGSGRQIVSWIRGEDLCDMIGFALENEGLRGVYNAVAPHPVSNRVLTLALARARCGRFFLALPVPAFVLKLMLGGGSIEVLKSVTVSSQRIQQAGFTFRCSTIEEAVRV
jgi:uncharacterized protein